MGHGQLIDSMIQDGLWDAYGDVHMGIYGDQWPPNSSSADGSKMTSRFAATRVPERQLSRESSTPKWCRWRCRDAAVPRRSRKMKSQPVSTRTSWPGLRPAFSEQGTVTAGNASSVNDGAAALVVASGAACANLRLKPLARIVGAATYSREPAWFTLAPIGAITRLMDRVDWSIATTDLFEINEAFANVAMAAQRELEIPAEKLNVFGGAVALGHPIGATARRILVTLLTGLKHTGGRRGVACLCIGGGEAVAWPWKDSIEARTSSRGDVQPCSSQPMRSASTRCSSPIGIFGPAI